jgi:hypothetical protein
MSGVRIYDLAKELKLTNNDLLDLLKGLGEPGKTASSTITDATAEAVRKMAAGGGAPTPASNGTTPHAVQRNGSAGSVKPSKEPAAPTATSSDAPLEAAKPASEKSDAPDTAPA